MQPSLKLAEKTLLFALDDDSGKICPLPEQYLNYAIVGSLLMDLTLTDHLEVSDKHLHVQTKAPLPEDKLLLQVLDDINAEDLKLPIDRTLAHLSAKAKGYIDHLLDALMEKENPQAGGLSLSIFLQ